MWWQSWLYQTKLSSSRTKDRINRNLDLEQGTEEETENPDPTDDRGSTAINKCCKHTTGQGVRPFYWKLSLECSDNSCELIFQLRAMCLLQPIVHGESKQCDWSHSFGHHKDTLCCVSDHVRTHSLLEAVVLLWKAKSKVEAIIWVTHGSAFCGSGSLLIQAPGMARKLSLLPLHANGRRD